MSAVGESYVHSCINSAEGFTESFWTRSLKDNRGGDAKLFSGISHVTFTPFSKNGIADWFLSGLNHPTEMSHL